MRGFLDRNPQLSDLAQQTMLKLKASVNLLQQTTK